MKRGIQKIIQRFVHFLYKSTAKNIIIPQNKLLIKKGQLISREFILLKAFSKTLISLQ